MKELLVAFLAIIILPFSVNASPFYREVFKRCDVIENTSTKAIDIAGWKAFTGASHVGKAGSLKVNVPGSLDHPVAFNSFPVGDVNGGAFWPKYAVDLTIFTDEFSFDISSLALVQYQQRLSGYDSTGKHKDKTQLALLIGKFWYISDQKIAQNNPGIWEMVSLEPTQLTYGTVPNINGRGPKNPENSNVPLPKSGIVTAFGVFINKAHGAVRIDNYTLSDLSLDNRNPGIQGNAEQCELINANGRPSGTNFCSGRNARALGKVATTKAFKRKLLRSVRGESIKALRDRAILALLLNNGLRVDNLVNVRVVDYYSVGSLQLLNASGVAKQTKRIKRSVTKLIDNYISATGFKSSSTFPLFQAIDRQTKELNGSALCTNNIAAIVRKSARRIKATDKVLLKS